MIRTLLCFCLLIFACLPSFSQAPPWLWAKDASSSGPEQAWDVACDKSTGNVYTCGSFNGNLSAFYGSSFTGSAGGLDGFVAKYSNTGTFISAFKIGGTNDDEVKSVTVDPYGNIYITGYFSTTTDFDPSAASFTMTPNGQDGFLAKYSSTGAFLWAVKFGDAPAELGWRVTADSNAVYITGNYMASATFYSTNAVTKNATANQALTNMFGAKYSTAGVVQWVISAGSIKEDVSYNVISDNNKVYFIGTYNQDLSVYDASGALGTTLQVGSPNRASIFISAYQQSGAFAWATNIASSSDNLGSGLTQDAGNLYVSGSFKSTASFPYPTALFTKASAGNTDIFLAKLSKSNGVFQWVSAETGSGGADETGYELDYDINGHIIMSGYFLSTLNYVPYGGPILATSGNEDIFVDAFDNAGNIIWAMKAGANGTDIPYGLCTDTAGGIFIAGQHGGNTVFGSTTITSAGNTNIFVAKTGCSIITNNTSASSQTICSGSVPSTLSGSSPSGAISPYTYTWQQSSNASTWSNASGTYTSQNYSPPALTANTYYRRQVVSGAGCSNASTSATVLITVNPLPATSNAGPNQNVCSASATLAANTPSVGSGTWSLLSGAGSITSPGAPGSGVTGLGPGQNKFIWTVSSGVCAASKDTVIITRDALPTTANAGANQVICSGSATFSANSIATGSGAWSLLSGSGTITSASSPSSTVNGLGTGANQFIWTASNGSCPASKDTVIITRNALPTPSNAGNDQVLCAATATLGANTPVTGTGAWSVLAGTGIVTTPSSPSSALSNLSTGTNKFIWTVSNGVCPASKDTVSITRDALPTAANAGTDQVICASSSTFSANSAVTGTGAWSLLSGTGVITATNSPSSAVNGLSTGTNKFIWTISNGTCPASKDTVSIKRDAVPTTANAGSDQTICASSSTLAANLPVNGTGAWSVLSGPGTVTTVSSYSSAVTGLGVGNNKFIWTISNGTCPSSKDTVAIMRDALPTPANAGSDQVICASSSTFSANYAVTGTGAWSLLSGTGVITATASPSSAVNGLGTGTNKFIWTISNGTCPASKDTVSISRDALPTTANAGSDQTICASSSTLAANTPVSGTGTWSVLSGGGSVSTVSSYSSAVNGLGVGVNQFIWTISNGTCPSSKDTLAITRDALPTPANAGNDQVICASSSAFSGNSAVIGTGAWSLLSGTGVITATASPSSTVNGLGTGTNKFIWTISNGTCPASKDTVSIKRDALPTPANAGSDQVLCSATATFNAVNPSVGTGSWSLFAGSGTVTNAASSTSPVNGLGTGNNTFIWTVSNGVCPASNDTVSITRDAFPTTANAGNDQALCAASATISANTAITGSGAWTVITGTGSITAASSATTGVTNLSIGVNQAVWTISNGTCPDSKDTVSITRDEVPTAALAGTDQVLCTATASFSANNATTGTGSWSVLSGTGTVANLTSPSSSVSNLTTGTNAFIWTISNGTCPPAKDTVIITRDASPTTANAGPDQVLCSPNSAFVANSPSNGSGLWSLASGSGAITAIASPTSAVTSLSTGANKFVWTISNGSCPDSQDTVVITRDALPSAAMAGTDQVICGPGSAFAANTPSIGQGTWSLLSGSGTIASVHASGSAVTSLGTGNNAFIWTVSNGSCPPTSDTVRIQSDALPGIANAGANQSLCSTSCTLNAGTGFTGTGSWSLASGSCTITAPGNANTGITNLAGGNSVLVWTISNGVCPASSASVTIHRDLPPTPASAGADQSICALNAVLSGNNPSSGAGAWSSLSGSAGIANPASASTSISGLSAGNNLFAWTISNGTCPASIDTVVVHADEPPAAPNAGPDQSICSPSAVLAAVNPVVGSGIWSLQSGTGSIANPTAYNSAITGLPMGITIFRWTVSNGVCPSLSDDVSVKRDSLPSAALAGPDQDLEIPAGQLSAIAPGTGSGSWSIISGSGFIDDPSNPSSTFHSLSTGDNIFEWRVANGSCPANTDQVTVYLEPFKIPNAFSPNGDNINDTFTVPGLDYYDGVKLSIFNRWGGVVYENDNYKNDWGGTNKSNEQLAEDTYYYTLDIAPKVSYSGYVILKRNK